MLFWGCWKETWSISRIAWDWLLIPVIILVGCANATLRPFLGLSAFGLPFGYECIWFTLVCGDLGMSSPWLLWSPWFVFSMDCSHPDQCVLPGLCSPYIVIILVNVFILVCLHLGQCDALGLSSPWRCVHLLVIPCMKMYCTLVSVFTLVCGHLRLSSP